jgi:hypothetical protein
MLCVLQVVCCMIVPHMSDTEGVTQENNTSYQIYRRRQSHKLPRQRLHSNSRHDLIQMHGKLHYLDTGSRLHHGGYKGLLFEHANDLL